MVFTRYEGIVENVLATEPATGSPNSKTNRASTGWTLHPSRPSSQGSTQLCESRRWSGENVQNDSAEKIFEHAQCVMERSASPFGIPTQALKPKGKSCRRVGVSNTGLLRGEA